MWTPTQTGWGLSCPDKTSASALCDITIAWRKVFSLNLQHRTRPHAHNCTCTQNQKALYTCCTGVVSIVQAWAKGIMTARVNMNPRHFKVSGPWADYVQLMKEVCTRLLPQDLGAPWQYFKTASAFMRALRSTRADPDHSKDVDQFTQINYSYEKMTGSACFISLCQSHNVEAP